MSNDTDHAARIAGIDQGLLIGNIRPEQARYLLDRVRELESEIRDRRAGQQSMTQRRHELEADLAAALARAEKAEAELSEARATIDLCAENIAAAALAQEVEFLRAERDAARAEVARLDEPWVECRKAGGGWQSICNADGCYHEQRTIRVVQQEAQP